MKWWMIALIMSAILAAGYIGGAVSMHYWREARIDDEIQKYGSLYMEAPEQ